MNNQIAEPEVVVTLEMIERYANAINGTCGNVSERMLEEIGLPDDFIVGDDRASTPLWVHFDSMVAECEDCGWWTSVSDISKGVCSSCK